MRSHPPFLLRLISFACRIIATPIAALHSSMVRFHILHIPLPLLNGRAGVYKTLSGIWHSRLYRRALSPLLRTPMRAMMVRSVNVNCSIPATGCVFVLCHTPWSRLLAQWCVANNFGWIVTESRWNLQTDTVRRTGKGFIDIRQLISHLQSGGKLIIMADVFNHLTDCPCMFLGRTCNVSLLPARLAMAAKVPVISAVPEIKNSCVHIFEGPRFEFNKSVAEAGVVMRSFLDFFETEIERNPSIWSVFVRSSLRSYIRHANQYHEEEAIHGSVELVQP